MEPMEQMEWVPGFLRRPSVPYSVHFSSANQLGVGIIKETGEYRTKRAEVFFFPLPVLPNTEKNQRAYIHTTCRCGT